MNRAELSDAFSQQHDKQESHEEDLRQRTEQQAMIDEVLALNDKALEQVSALKDQMSEVAAHLPIIILGQLQDGQGLYGAAQISQEISMTSYSYGGKRRKQGKPAKEMAIIRFYELNEADAAMVKANPFLARRDLTGDVQYIEACVPKEKTLSADQVKELGDNKIKLYRKPQERPRASMVAAQVSERSDQLDKFSASLEWIAKAITDRELNPSLIEMIEQRQAQRQAAA
jgi:hypothetical protein